MAEYRYSLVRYFADPIRDEPLNVGVIIHSSAEHHIAFRFDLRRASTKLSSADRDSFKHFQEELEAIEREEIAWHTARFENIPVSEPDFLFKVADNIGNKIRFSAPRGLVTDKLGETFDDLFARFVSAEVSIPPGTTKRTLVRQVKEAFSERGIGEYVKANPTVQGKHRDYKLKLGIRHSHKTFVEVLNLGEGSEKDYRAMAAVGRLWRDARGLRTNRSADLCVVVHYSKSRVKEGEQLLKDDGVQVFLDPAAVLAGVDIERVRDWD